MRRLYLALSIVLVLLSAPVRADVGVDPIKPYRAATAVSSNIDISTLTGLGLVVADVPIAAPGIPILLTGQINPAENGIYVSDPGPWQPGAPSNVATPTEPIMVFIGKGTMSRAVCQSTDWQGSVAPSTWACMLPDGPYYQSKSSELAADSSCGTTPSAVASVSLTTSTGTTLIVDASASAANLGLALVSVSYRVWIDGVAVRGFAQSIGIASKSTGSIALRVPGLAAGPHTVALDCRTALGSIELRPLTTIDEHASLRVQEVRS